MTMNKNKSKTNKEKYYYDLAARIKELPIEMVVEILRNFGQPEYYVSYNGEVFWFDTLEKAITEYISYIHTEIMNFSENGPEDMYFEIGKVGIYISHMIIDSDMRLYINDSNWINFLTKIHYNSRIKFDFREAIRILKNTKVNIWIGNTLNEDTTVLQ